MSAKAPQLPTTPYIIHGDPEHDGIRRVVMFIVLIGLLVGYWLIRSYIKYQNPTSMPDYTFMASCGGGMLLALITAGIAEMILKRTWPSGRRLVLDEKGITLAQPYPDPVQLLWSEPIMAIQWHFNLTGFPRAGKERRVKATWHCIGAQLFQGNERIVLYTFMSPEQVTEWLTPRAFEQIYPAKHYENSLGNRLKPPERPELSADLLRSPIGRFWIAERNRWEQGLELTVADVQALLELVPVQLVAKR